MIKRLDHVGVAVADLAAALKLYQRFGLRATQELELPDDGMRVIFMAAGDGQVELLASMGEQSVLAKFLASQGPGLHHLCFETDDIESALRDLEADGFELIDQHPRPGAQGRVAFIHPHSGEGVLIELVEKDGGPKTEDR